MRELQELTPTKLAEITGISQTDLAAIENGTLALNVEQAEMLARALRCHPLPRYSFQAGMWSGNRLDANPESITSRQ